MKNSMKQDQRVIFMHIHKTAGTTLQKILNKQYKRADTKVLNGFDHHISEDEKKKIKCVYGHAYVGLHEFFDGPSTYITVLRDPIDRIISHYYYVFQNVTHPLFKEVTSRQMSLDEFVFDGMTTTENGQTRTLGGLHITGRIRNVGLCPREVFEKAKKNLDKYFTIAGLTERFDETLILLRKAFGWRNIFYTKWNVTNSRPKKNDVSKEALKVIEKYNQFDIELYRYAKERFEEQLRQQGPSFDKELKEFRYLNDLYGKFYGNHYLSLYEFLRPMTKGFRNWMRAGRAVCLAIVSTSIFESTVLLLDNIF